MSHGRRDLDDVLESAWRRFQALLADALDEFESPAMLDVRRESGAELDGVAAYVRVRREPDQIVVEAANNRILATSHRLSKAARRQLRELGFTKLPKPAPHYVSTLPSNHVDQAAYLVVNALRLGYGVVHPSFLDADALEWHGPSDLQETRASVEVVRPGGRAQLDEMIDEALHRMLGHPPHRDSDGDIPYREGTAVVFIRTRGHSSLIRLFAEMVVGVQDHDAAVREVDALNREILGIKFTLKGDRVVASAELQGSPFVAEHLQILLAHLADTVATRDAELAQQLGGRVFADPDSVEPGVDASQMEGNVADIHPVMFSLFQIDSAGPGALRASIAAELCGHDPTLLNNLIRWNQDQEAQWRKSRDHAHTANEPEFAEVCEAQRKHAARTLRVLRKALRRVEPS